MGAKKAENDAQTQEIDLFDAQTTKKLFYDSDDPDDKLVAIRIAKPYFSEHDVAANIIVDASCQRYGCTQEMAKEANTIIYDSISMYINRLIHDSYNSYVSTGDYARNADLTQTLHACAMAQILNDIKSYDSTKSKPITFMHRSIMYGISQYIMETHGAPSRAYGLQMKKVHRAVDALKSRGIEPTIDQIKHEINDELSEEQIDNALNLLEINATMQSIDQIDERQAAYDTPEEAFLKADSHKQLCEGLENLDKDERDVLCLTYGIDPDTFESISAGETQKAISERLNMSQDTVKRNKTTGLNKLRIYYNFGQTTTRNTNDSYTDDILRGSDVPLMDDQEDEDLITLCQSIIAI